MKSLRLETKPGAGSTGTDRVSNLWKYVGVVLLFCVLVVVREPQILLKERIWGEDALYFQAALGRSFLSTIAFVRPGLGYSILLQNLSAYFAAHWVPLELAPLVFCAFGLVLQALPLVLLLLARDRLGLSPHWFGIIGLGFLLNIPNYDSWLTTTTSGFLLSVAVAVVLISPVGSGWQKWLARVILPIAACTGLASLFLIPFFVYRAIRGRQRERILQSLIFTVAGAAQVLVVLTHGTGGRKYFFSSDGILAAIFTNQVLLRFVGHNLIWNADSFVSALRSEVVANQLTAHHYATLLGSTAILIGGLYWVSVKSRREEVPYLFLSALSLSTLSTMGSLGGSRGYRVRHHV